MLRIEPTEAAIIACLAKPEVLAGVAGAGAFRAVVARDEVWLIGGARRRSQLLDLARAQVEPAGGLVVDQTDGWSMWTVRGQGAEVLWRRLSVIPVPSSRPAFVQGAVAAVPGRTIFAEGAIHVLVPSPVGHHLRERMLEAGRDLGPTLDPASEFKPGANPR